MALPKVAIAHRIIIITAAIAFFVWLICGVYFT